MSVASMSVASRVELADRTVAALRRSSLNPHVAIMAGGKPLIENPQLAFQIEADAVCCDAPAAVVLAAHLLMPASSATKLALTGSRTSKDGVSLPCRDRTGLRRMRA